MGRGTAIGAPARPARIGPSVWILLAAVLFSTGGAGVKLSTLEPLAIAGLRSGLAALVLLVFSKDSRRGYRSARELLVAAAFAATMLLFVLASRNTTAASAVFLQATAPLYLIFLAPAILGEKLRRSDIVTLAGMGVGLALFFAAPGASQETAPRPLFGNILGAASGLSWALAILGLRWIGVRGRDGGETLRVVMLGNALVAIGVLPFALPIAVPGTTDVLVLGWLGVVQIALAYVCVAKGIRGVPAFTASLLFLVEPVLNPVWAYLVHGERVGVASLAGGILILAFATPPCSSATTCARPPTAWSTSRTARRRRWRPTCGRRTRCGGSASAQRTARR